MNGRVVRAVSLVPSLTESAIALGVSPIACTRFCEQPHIAHVGGTKNPDIDAIVALQPDVVLMDREENRREDADALLAAGLDVHVTAVRSVGDVDAMLIALADRLGSDRRIDAPHPPAVPAGTCTAFVPIWRRPWMTISAATYGSSLLESIGVVNVFADHADAYPTITLDDVVGLAPQLVLLPSEPYSFEQRHIDEIVAALPSAAVHRIDGQDLFWWGARTAAATERLRRAVGQATGSIAP